MINTSFNLFEVIYIYNMKATILTIGDEILIGQIIDTNSVWLGEQLYLEGVHVVNMITIPDTKEVIKSTLEKTFENSDLIVTTGGLGPTKDDITKKAIAEFLKVDSYFDAESFGYLTALFAKFGRKTNESHKEQCYMPLGVQLLRNKMGTAPGMLFKYQGKHLLSMPGVPYEMKWIFKNSFAEDHLRTWEKGFAQVNKTIHTVGRGETDLEDQINDIVKSFPEDLSMSYLPSLGKVRLRINGRGPVKEDVVKKVRKAAEDIKETLGNLVFGEDKASLESAVLELFRQQNKTIGTAESCTGGNIARGLTSIPGSSDVFQGAIVAYSNALKESLLSVSPETLRKYGAVSEQTVIEMVKGALITLGVDVAVAVSGIAGPGGGTPEKPVGTIWLACGGHTEIRTKRLNLAKNRGKNIEYTSNMALNMLRQYLM